MVVTGFGTSDGACQILMEESRRLGNRRLSIFRGVHPLRTELRLQAAQRSTPDSTELSKPLLSQPLHRLKAELHALYRLGSSHDFP